MKASTLQHWCKQSLARIFRRFTNQPSSYSLYDFPQKETPLTARASIRGGPGGRPSHPIALFKPAPPESGFCDRQSYRPSCKRPTLLRLLLLSIPPCTTLSRRLAGCHASLIPHIGRTMLKLKATQTSQASSLSPETATVLKARAKQLCLPASLRKDPGHMTPASTRNLAP